MVLAGAGTVLPPVGSDRTLRQLARRPPTLARLSLDQVFDYVHQGRLTIWITPAQIDELGNANISCIGPWRQPHVALVGSRGLPDDSVNLRGMCYYVPRHSARVFTKRVDFVSAVGNERPAATAPWGRPRWLVSNLGVFDFGGPGGRLRLIGRYPGVDVAEIRDQTGGGLDLPAAVPLAPAPSAGALALIRRLDPENWRDREF